MKYSELTRSEVPEFKSRITEAKGEVSTNSLRAFVDSFSIGIQIHEWIPKDKIIATDKCGNMIGVIDLESPRTKFFKLLNLGSVSE